MEAMVVVESQLKLKVPSSLPFLFYFCCNSTSAGKVALNDQKTAKTVGKILHQKAQWIAEKIGQKLLTTRKVVAEACQRFQIVKLKNGGSMNSIMSVGIGQFSKRKRTEGEGRLCRFPPAGT